MAFYQFFSGLGIGFLLSILLMLVAVIFSGMIHDLKDGLNLPEKVGATIGGMVFGGFHAVAFIFLAKIALEDLYRAAGALGVIAFFLYHSRKEW